MNDKSRNNFSLMNILILIIYVRLLIILSFNTLLDNFVFFADLRYLSRPPLKSTVLRAALVTFKSYILFKTSLLKVIFLRFGKKLRLVLLLAWLTLWPFKGNTPVSSHFLVIGLLYKTKIKTWSSINYELPCQPFHLYF